MTTNIIALIPVLTFSLLVLIILALCVYKRRRCCKFKDAEHANTQRPDTLTVYLADEQMHGLDSRGGDRGHDIGMKESLANLIIAADEKPVVWAPPQPPPAPDPPNPNS